MAAAIDSHPSFLVQLVALERPVSTAAEGRRLHAEVRHPFGAIAISADRAKEDGPR